jgi:hypothetical protein
MSIATPQLHDILHKLRKYKSDDMICEQDVLNICSKYSVEINQDLIDDLHLFAKAKRNFNKGKDLLLLVLSYKQEVLYDTMYKFGLCGNGNSSKRNLSNTGFIFESIGTSKRKGLKCTGFDIRLCVERNIFTTKIKKHFKNVDQSCCMCGSSSNLEIDHKKPIKRKDFLPHDDPDSIESYQLLCNRCNALKRERCIACVKTDKIINRPDIQFLYSCKEVYDGTCEGCYWYDYKTLKKAGENA